MTKLQDLDAQLITKLSNYSPTNKDEMVIACRDLANQWQSSGRERKAIEWYEKALSLLDLNVVEDLSTGIPIQRALGSLWIALGKHRDAVKYFQMVLDGEKRCHGEQSLEVAGAHYALGSLFKSLVRRKPAEANLTKSLEILTSLLGQDHPHAQKVANSLADIKK